MEHLEIVGVVFCSRSNQNQIEVPPIEQPWDWLIREWRSGKPIIRSQLIRITEKKIIQIMGRERIKKSQDVFDCCQFFPDSEMLSVSFS